MDKRNSSNERSLNIPLKMQLKYVEDFLNKYLTEQGVVENESKKLYNYLKSTADFDEFVDTFNTGSIFLTNQCNSTKKYCDEDMLDKSVEAMKPKLFLDQTKLTIQNIVKQNIGVAKKGISEIVEKTTLPFKKILEQASKSGFSGKYKPSAVGCDNWKYTIDYTPCNTNFKINLSDPGPKKRRRRRRKDVSVETEEPKKKTRKRRKSNKLIHGVMKIDQIQPQSLNSTSPNIREKISSHSLVASAAKPEFGLPLFETNKNYQNSPNLESSSKLGDSNNSTGSHSIHNHFIQNQNFNLIELENKLCVDDSLEHNNALSSGCKFPTERFLDGYELSSSTDALTGGGISAKNSFTNERYDKISLEFKTPLELETFTKTPSDVVAHRSNTGKLADSSSLLENYNGGTSFESSDMPTENTDALIGEKISAENSFNDETYDKTFTKMPSGGVAHGSNTGKTVEKSSFDENFDGESLESDKLTVELHNGAHYLSDDETESNSKLVTNSFDNTERFTDNQKVLGNNPTNNAFMDKKKHEDDIKTSFNSTIDENKLLDKED